MNYKQVYCKARKDFGSLGVESPPEPPGRDAGRPQAESPQTFFQQGRVDVDFYSTLVSNSPL